MNIQAIIHNPKSNMSFPIDKETLQLTLITAKGDFNKCEVILSDPFDYRKDESGRFMWWGRHKALIQMDKKYSTDLNDIYIFSAKTDNYRSKYSFVLSTDTDVYLYNSVGLTHLSTVSEFHKLFDYNNKEAVDTPLFSLAEFYNYPYINEEDVYNSPEWSKNTIWYQIFPDRFSTDGTKKEGCLEFGSVVEGINNHQLFGGSLRGVINRIPYLVKLGVTGIYFTPIFLSPSAHKYDTTNYLLIDPQFGTNADFKELVDKLHENGIKIILDAVFNHCGWNHEFFQDVVKYGKNSKYYDCFYFDGTEGFNFPIKDGQPDGNDFYPRINYRAFAFTPFMPKLNTSHPIIEKYLLDITKYWMENYNIDGWRLDVSNEVSHRFWRKFRTLVKSINKDAYILGENWDDSTPWLMGDQLDAVMNYGLALPVWKFFCPNFGYHIDANTFKNQIVSLLTKYPYPVTRSLFNLIDSHDTPRILHRCAENKQLMKMAYLFMFSYPGNPNIYYGDEIGITGGMDPNNRRCMIWDEDKQDLELFHFMKELITLRKTSDDFISCDFTFLINENSLLVYKKGNTYFLYNVNSKPIKFTLPSELQNTTVYSVFCNSDKHLKEEFVIGGYKYFVFEK